MSSPAPQTTTTTITSTRWYRTPIAKQGMRRRGMASDWEAGERQGDCKGELGPVERSETGTVANVFDCKARQTKREASDRERSDCGRKGG